MKNEEFIKAFEQSLSKMLETVKAKNADYSGANPFENFEATEKLEIATVEQGFLTRMLDKVMRIKNVLKAKETHVKDESLQDTLLDLMSIWLKEKSNKLKRD
jgi:antirestriction protein